MRVDYNVTGPKRKALAEAVKKETGCEIKYLGVPTFAYQIGDYHIDRGGVLTGPDNLRLINELSENYNLHADVIKEDAYNSLTIEIPRSGFTDSKIENLKKLIKSKEVLIKKALDADSLRVVVGNEKVSFPWFLRVCTPDEVDAYTQFILALSDTAKSRMRVNAVEKTIKNEKYAFRTFLLRLGFIGPQYKKARGVLLSKLSGNSAFRDGKPETITGR